MKSLLTALLFLAASVAASADTAGVPVPGLLSYQGHVTDSTGAAIGTSSPVNRTITFKLYSASSAGTPLYAEAQTVTISGGDFSVLIGNGTGVAGLAGSSAPALTPYVTLASAFTTASTNATNLYLGITVDDGTAAVDPEISPRQQIVSAAYAFRAKVAEGLVPGSLSTAMLSDTAVTTNKIGADQVTTVKILDANIVTSKLADGSVTTPKLADAAVTTAKLAVNAVTNEKITPGTITSANIGTGQVTSANIADNTVASIDLKDGGITTADLGDGMVTLDKMATNSVDLNRLVDAVKQALCPTGTILSFAGDTAPPGWVMCDGSSLSRTTYSALFAIVGTRFGAPDSSNFRVPDFRGRFLRGRDNNAGNDPDRASRTAMNTGGAIGDLVGSVQADDFKSHVHDLPRDTGGKHSIQTVTDTSNSDEDISSLSQTGPTGGNETRPKNASVNFIIKL